MEQRRIRYTDGVDLQGSYQGLTLSKSALSSNQHQPSKALKENTKSDKVWHEDKYLAMQSISHDVYFFSFCTGATMLTSLTDKHQQLAV